MRWPSGRCTMCESGGRLRIVACWPSLGGRPLIRSRRSTSLSSARVYEAPFVVRRQRDRHAFLPGQSCVWDPEQGHSGSTSAAAWSAELVIVPEAELVEAFGDDVSLTCAPGEITSEGSRCAVAALHRSLRSGDRLAIEVELTSVAHSLFVHRPSVRLARSATADRRLRAARDLLVDRLAENVTLAELAGVAGMDRFPLRAAVQGHVRAAAACVPPSSAASQGAARARARTTGRRGCRDVRVLRSESPPSTFPTVVWAVPRPLRLRVHTVGSS